MKNKVLVYFDKKDNFVESILNRIDDEVIILEAGKEGDIDFFSLINNYKNLKFILFFLNEKPFIPKNFEEITVKKILVDINDNKDRWKSVYYDMFDYVFCKNIDETSAEYVYFIDNLGKKNIFKDIETLNKNNSNIIQRCKDQAILYEYFNLVKNYEFYLDKCLTKKLDEQERLGFLQLKANLYYNNGRFIKAIELYDEILKVNSNLEDILFFKALSLLELLKYKKAKAIFKKLNTINSENIDYIFYLGFCQFNLKEFSQAKSNLTKVLQKNPDNEYAKNMISELEKPLVSIVIPVYNNLFFLKNLINSIYNNTNYIKYEVILIDNNSTEDGIKDYIESIKVNYNIKLKTIFNSDNLGFSKANNQGFKIAEGEYIVLLGTDMIVTKNWLTELVLAFDLDKKIGAIQCKIIKATEQDSSEWRVQTCGAMFNDKYFPIYYLNDIEPNDIRVNETFYIEAFMGCGVIIKKAILDSVKGFDENYDLVYLEDTDLSLKLSELGYNILYFPKSLVYHFHGLSVSLLKQERVKKSLEHNKKLYTEKWIKSGKIQKILDRIREDMKKATSFC